MRQAGRGPGGSVGGGGGSGNQTTPPRRPREILYEIQRAGQWVRVAAIDAATGTEVVLAGPASSSLHSLKQNAARKLAYVLDKAAKTTDRPPSR